MARALTRAEIVSPYEAHHDISASVGPMVTPAVSLSADDDITTRSHPTRSTETARSLLICSLLPVVCHSGLRFPPGARV